jgi:hypothetical protein
MRPLRSLATRRPFSYSAKAPATWRIILRPRSSLSVKSSLHDDHRLGAAGTTMQPSPSR